MAAEFLTGDAAAVAQRAVKTWINTCTELPQGVAVSFENLEENAVGICFSTEQSPMFAAKYILGGYKAQYQMQIIYRVLPSDDGDMLDAVDTLTAISAWCHEHAASLALEGAVNIHIERTSDAAILSAYEDGTSDYGCGITITWEVLKYA